MGLQKRVKKLTSSKRYNNKRYIYYKYPDTPNQHIVGNPTSKSNSVIDSNYKFEDNRIFFRVCSGMLRAVALVFMPLWAFLWMRTRVKGRKHFRALKKQGLIIVSNHVHTLDAPVIGALATRTRKVRIVTLKANLELPVGGKAIKMLGGIPIADSYGGMKKFTKTIDDLLQRKKPILFYPEEALWPYYTGLRPFNPGGFKFAVKNNVPVLPVVYTFKIGKNGKKKRLQLNILPAIYPDNLSAEELAQKTRQVMLKKMQEFYSSKKYNKSGQEIKVLFESQVQTYPDSQAS